MSSYYLKLEEFISNGKNLNKIIFFLVIFLLIVKCPPIFESDIQPWDEGMYATRVLSVHQNGDFLDQSSHSVGNFYSGSHPPLLIWIGYFVTLIFGVNSVILKIIPLVFSLLCVVLILLIGKKLFDIQAGFFAALIFCSNIVFNIFSKRFQFDIPYTFFILLSFYTIFLFNDTLKYKYLVIGGISFGLCLMTKILVGFYIPLILFLSYFFIKSRVRFRFKHLVILTSIGILIALPWHIYMLYNHGSDFLNFFFKFHIYDRAFQGVEMNEKRSGMFYHINYLLSIIPYSILIAFSFVSDFRKLKKLNWKKIFLWVWFLTGLVIITLFKTKLEVYMLLILMPGCFLIPLFIKDMDKESRPMKILIILFTIFNILWFATESVRPELKLYAAGSDKLFLLFGFFIFTIMLIFLSKYLAGKIELKKVFYIFILFFFFSLNLFYLFKIPEWENKYNLSEIKKYIELNPKKTIIYVGTGYRFNPQFSFYFNGLNLNWEKPLYEFEQLDTKDNIETVRSRLRNLTSNDYFIIVEKDYINRADYPDSHLFLPLNSKFIMKRSGYELYEN